MDSFPLVRRIAAAGFLLLLAGCSAVPPVNRGPQSAAVEQGLVSRSGLRPVVFPDIPSVQAIWRPAGVKLAVFAGQTKKPRLEFWALKIELDPPGGKVEGNRRLRILIGAGSQNGDGGLPRFGYVSSTRVSSFVRDNGLAAGINTVPFDPSSAREGEERKVVGLGIAGGRLIAPPVPRYDALVFYEDGGAAIVNQGELAEPGNPGGFADPAASAGETGRKILHAAGGFHSILRDGELTGRAQRPGGPRYARSAAGLSSGGRILYLAVINGGRISGPGATEAETALILKQLGAQDVLNLDGGGSSALVLRFPDGQAAVLNTPVHAGIPGRERAVALCLGIGEE